MGHGMVSPDVEVKEKHDSAIASLCEQFHLPAVTVAEVYERELASIKQDALITTYLPILVTRRVSALLRKISTPEKQSSGLAR